MVHFARMQGPEVSQIWYQKEDKETFSGVLCSENLAQTAGFESSKMSWDSSDETSMPTSISWNKVFAGSYLSACHSAKYEDSQDILTCQLGEQTLTLPQPYVCADDISVNLKRKLVC